MASYPLRFLLQVTDINGDTAEVSFPDYLADTTTVANLATAMALLEPEVAAITNGKITRQSVRILFNEAQYIVGTAPPTDAEYSSVTDGARIQIADGLGERSSFTIPAPIEAVFGANSNVVDSTQVGVAALLASIAVTLKSTSGNFYNLYKGGIKTGRRARRRRSALIP